MNNFVIFEETDGSYTINVNGGEIIIKGKQMKHKHAELIKAWADGATIQYKYKCNDYDWLDDDEPEWYREDFEFRIKPEPKPDVVEELTLYRNLAVPFGTVEMQWANPKHYYPMGNFRIIRDGETGELKSAEVLK